jgi:hypothetical protein
MTLISETKLIFDNIWMFYIWVKNLLKKLQRPASQRINYLITFYFILTQNTRSMKFCRALFAICNSTFRNVVKI